MLCVFAWHNRKDIRGKHSKHCQFVLNIIWSELIQYCFSCFNKYNIKIHLIVVEHTTEKTVCDVFFLFAGVLHVLSLWHVLVIFPFLKLFFLSCNALSIFLYNTKTLKKKPYILFIITIRFSFTRRPLRNSFHRHTFGKLFTHLYNLCHNSHITFINSLSSNFANK